MTEQQMKEAQEWIASVLRTGGASVVDVPEFDSSVMEPPGVVVSYGDYDLWIEIQLL